MKPTGPNSTVSPRLSVSGSSLFFRFAGNKILQKYCYLLSFHATNSDCTNHCIVKMLHRIAVSLKLAPLLYQVTLFKTFQEILSSHSTRYKVTIREVTQSIGILNEC